MILKKKTNFLMLLTLTLLTFSSCEESSNENLEYEVNFENKQSVIKNLKIENFSRLNTNRKYNLINKVGSNPEKYDFKKIESIEEAKVLGLHYGEVNMQVFSNGEWVFTRNLDLLRNKRNNVNAKSVWNYEYFLDGEMNINTGMIEAAVPCEGVTDICDGSDYYGIKRGHFPRSAFYLGDHGECDGGYRYSIYIYADDNDCGDLYEAYLEDPAGGIYPCDGICY